MAFSIGYLTGIVYIYWSTIYICISIYIYYWLLTVWRYNTSFMKQKTTTSSITRGLGMAIFCHDTSGGVGTSTSECPRMVVEVRKTTVVFCLHPETNIVTSSCQHTWLACFKFNGNLGWRWEIWVWWCWAPALFGYASWSWWPWSWWSWWWKCWWSLSSLWLHSHCSIFWMIQSLVATVGNKDISESIDHDCQNNWYDQLNLFKFTIHPRNLQQDQLNGPLNLSI